MVSAEVHLTVENTASKKKTRSASFTQIAEYQKKQKQVEHST